MEMKGEVMTFSAAAASSPGSATRNKLDRKTVERNRRIHMKGLCLCLTSLVPPHYFSPSRVKKQLLTPMSSDSHMSSPASTSFIVPVVDLRELGSSNIEVVVISGLAKNFRLCDVISVLQDEGTDVISVNVSSVGDRVFHTLHAQVKVCRVGVDITRVWQRFQELMPLAYLCEDA
ncbi:transcription factor bHLH168 isoform X2 [Daucus carota subsp. sativus]|uniref:transcription factor bHLH168 isoform X2 n=1 Tax=Daucus carota subsp. sativus TaxID=79200 RepID=UPI0007EFDFFD|nr:PREDICTED: uncharacterized protein LOC108213548 isoform X2 [Daucus carota subsp. sativus]